MLQVPQCDRKLLHSGLGFGRQERGDFLERLGEVAIFVQRVDQHHHERAVALVKICKRELRQQVVAQRRRGGRGEVAVAILLVLGGAAPVRRDVGRPVGLRRGGLGGRAGGGGGQ